MRILREQLKQFEISFCYLGFDYILVDVVNGKLLERSPIGMIPWYRPIVMCNVVDPTSKLLKSHRE